MVSVKSVSDYQYDINSLKKHGKSFYWASFFLPRKNKQIASELYSICRYFDDLADASPKDLSEEIKTEYQNIISNDTNEINKFFKKNKINLVVDQKYFPISSNKVSKLNVMFSTSFGRQLEYYTGMVFKIDIKSNSKIVNYVNGGRYDGLISDLGSQKKIPAVGAAFNL